MRISEPHKHYTARGSHLLSLGYDDPASIELPTRCENCGDLHTDDEPLCLDCRRCSPGFPYCWEQPLPPRRRLVTAKCAALVVSAEEVRGAA
jgi:hypothetical protein